MKNIFAILASANSGISLTTTALLVLILPYISLSQIKIEERVEILPGGVNNVLLDGSISGDSRNPAYIAYGGSVRVRAINASSFGTYELWEETYGRIPNVLTTVNLGIYPQWHKFVFYLLNPITQQKYYPEPGDLIVWDFPSTIDFYPSRQPGDPYPPNPEHWWEIRIVVDYSLAAMPPPEILNYFGNPFAQSQPLEVPLDGSLYAVIYPYTNANDELWMDLPGTQLIQDDIKNHYGETFELGDMTAGDEIRFFLNSSNTIVSGSNLYPLCEVVEDPTPTGDILLWRLYFEDWTDLLFDDVKIEIYIRPEGDYPGNIAAIVEPEELAPGDTASITFKKRYLNGTLEDFPEWKTFEVGMVEGCDLGNLLVDGELAPYFYDVMPPVYFVADSSADTGTVKLQVALVEEIIGLRPVQNNSVNEPDKQIKTENPKQKGNLKEVISARRENRTKPVNENEKIYENVTPSNPENVICPIEQILNSSPFEISLKDEEIEIMLGETKYFQAKYKDPLSNKLTIEEVIPGPNGVPQLNGGLAMDVWGDNPVSVDTGNNYGKKMGVYWEKEKPMVNGQNLPTGLIRLVGRYWFADSTYIVTLRALRENGDSGLVKIVVTKPSQLLSEGQTPTYKTATDVLGKPFSVDSLCIYWGGLYGIPPQMLKGHMLTESHFKPSYRYEPYTGQFYVDAIVKKNTNPFIVSETGMGKPGAMGVPTKSEHKGVWMIHYYEEQKSVWDFITENSQLVNADNNSQAFGSQHKTGRKKGQIKKNDNYTILNKYEKFLMVAEDSVRKRNDLKDGTKLSDSLQIIANDSARIAFLDYLQYDWKGKDLDKVWAQTRIAASYGLIQIMYQTSIREGFKTTNSDRPEKLNEPQEFKYQIYHYNTLFNKNRFSLNETNNYVSNFKYYNNRKLVFEAGPGFDEAFRTVAFLWNAGRISYHKEVFNNVKLFYPGD